VYFENTPSSMILPKGVKNYKVFTQENEKKRVTVGLCCSADGHKYEPQIIFKGTHEGRIYQEECANNNRDPNR